MEIDEALLWLARSGGTLKFTPVAMPAGVPAHARAGYALTAAVPGPDGPAVTAEVFVGSFDARAAGLSPAVATAVSELKARATGPATLPVARPRPTAPPVALSRAA